MIQIFMQLGLAVKKMFHRVGIDLISVKKSPRLTLLGLRGFPIMTILDVGANTGEFARMVREYFPKATIHCFEPLPDAFETLSRWAEGEHGKVRTHRIALGDTDGDGTLYRHIDHDTSSSMLNTTKTLEEVFDFTKRQDSLSVTVRKMDRFISESNISIEPEMLIKLDVQGYEDRVVRGGVETFGKASACVLEINIEGFYEKQAGFHGLTNLLYELGFRYAGNLDQTYTDDGSVLYIDAVFIRKRPE